jgi:hypothetical protein
MTLSSGMDACAAAAVVTRMPDDDGGFGRAHRHVCANPGDRSCEIPAVVLLRLDKCRMTARWGRSCS